MGPKQTGENCENKGWQRRERGSEERRRKRRDRKPKGEKKEKGTGKGGGKWNGIQTNKRQPELGKSRQGIMEKTRNVTKAEERKEK